MTQNYPLIKFACLVLAGGCLLTASTSSADPLLRNGSFTDGLSDWRVPAALQGWTPLQAGEFCSTETDDYTYNGPVLVQNLNYGGIGGKMLTASIDVRNDWAPGQPPVVVTVDYIGSGDARESLDLFEVQPVDVTTGWNTVSGSATLPAGAQRLVGISVRRINGAGIQFDNVQLDGSGLSAGPLPALDTVRPYVALHGQTVTLTGANFGASPGKVLLNLTDAGITIGSWGSSEITISLAPTVGSGRLVVETSEGVRSSEVRGLEVASPYMKVGMPRRSFQALVGQTLVFEAYVQAHSGYVPNGPVVLSCPELPGSAVFTPGTLGGSGGTAVELDLDGLGAGVHTLTLQAMDGNGIPYTSTLTVEILVLDHIVLSYFNPSYEAIEITSPFSITEQKELETLVQLYGTGDTLLSWELNTLEWTSSNPGVLQLYFDQFSGMMLLPQVNGTATLTATGPGGFTAAYTINVNLPAEPKVTGVSFSSNPIPNDGADNYFFYASCVPSCNFLGITGMLVTDVNDVDFGSSATREFSIVEGHQPGIFAMSAGALGGGTRAILLEVVNAADRAQISGMARMLDEPDQMFGQGRLELYDATSGALVLDMEIFSHSKDFVATYLPPGAYKLRFVPDPWISDHAPVWHPSASSFADAEVVNLSAGDALEGIHFFFLPELPPAPQPPDPVMNAGQFSIVVPTEAGAAYVIEVSDTLNGSSWDVLIEFTGDGNPQDIVDDLAAAGGKRFYRVRKL